MRRLRNPRYAPEALERKLSPSAFFGPAASVPSVQVLVGPQSPDPSPQPDGDDDLDPADPAPVDPVTPDDGDGSPPSDPFPAPPIGPSGPAWASPAFSY